MLEMNRPGIECIADFEREVGKVNKRLANIENTLVGIHNYLKQILDEKNGATISEKTSKKEDGGIMGGRDLFGQDKKTSGDQEK